jgi:cytochrome P450/NADPH-cytochrome P450 reductase
MRRSAREDVDVPQPPALPLVGNLPNVDIDRSVHSMMELAREFGPIFRLQFPHREMLVVSSHELVRQLEDQERFQKMVHGPLKHIRDFAGDGLFTARTDEPNWGKAHRILMPAFGQVALREYFEPMVDIADQMLTKWERLGSDTHLDVADNMTRLTLDTIALCGFDYRFNSFYREEMHPFVESMVRALREAGARARRPPIQTRLMPSTRRQYAEDIEFMHDVVDDVIEARRNDAGDREANDLLGRMLDSRDPETGDRLDDANIRHQIVTFLIAGHETTSGLLSFTTHALLKHPEVLAKARREADAVLGDEAPRFEHLSDLTYIEQVLRESLRLWPTAPAYAVQPTEDTVLRSGDTRYEIEEGEQILTLLPMLHRDPEVWSGDVEQFDPERFAPERIEKRPSNAWKPFGRGQRACIGRPFAMQEAKLVVAMMLRRFNLDRVGEDDLQVKETLTLKPEGLEMRVERRQEAPRARAPADTPSESSGDDAEAGSSQSPDHETPLLVLYGSNSGSSEAFARQIASDGGTRGWKATVAPMDDYVDDLPDEGALVVVTASYNGQPPDNAVQFCEWLGPLEAGDLEEVQFAVFGCGHRDWAETYQQVPRRVDEALADAGGQRLLERGEADAGGDFFGDFDDWYESFWPVLDETFDVDADPVDDGPLYDVERVDEEPDPLTRNHDTRLATVLDNRELVDMGASFARSKRHLELQLPEGVDYETGDYLVVLPENTPERVERAARRFGFELDDTVRLATGQSETSALPTDRPLRIDELLGRYIDLSAPASRRDLETLAEQTKCPPEKQKLQRLADDSESFREEVLDKNVSLLELVEETASCTVEFDEFLEMLPPMRPRQYSISSSPRTDEHRCSLTVAVVDAPAWSGHGRYRGTCSNFLARARPGDRLEVSVRSPNQPFRPPASPDVPMVMIGAGSGIAPFRGFIQERAASADTGEDVGPTMLFFGCDHPDVDFLYEDELDAWQEAGVVDVYPAFSEAPDGDIDFVQHRLWAERERVAELFGTEAHFFVCGDGDRMAPAARETLVRIRETCTEDSRDEAEAWLDELADEGRYVADVFT